jgi:predicted permease
MFLAVNFSCFMIVLSVMLSKNQESNQKIHRLIIVCSVPRNLLAPLFVPVRIGLTIALVKNTI